MWFKLPKQIIQNQTSKLIRKLAFDKIKNKWSFYL